MLKVTEVQSIPLSDKETRIVSAGFLAIARQRERLTAAGILDADGKLINKDLPPDMRDSSETQV